MTTPLPIAAQDAAPHERAFNLCLIQLHQLRPDHVTFNNRKAMSYGLMACKVAMPSGLL